MKEFDCSMGFGSRAGKQKRLLPFVGILLVLGCLSGLFVLPNSAFAQNTCNDLPSNAEWNDGMKNVVQLVQANRFTDARTKARTLSRICDQSPMLHYMQGKIAEGLGESAEALLHYQKASEYTYLFAVEPEMAKKIWYARYENEHPERTAESLEESAKQSEIKYHEGTSALMSQFHDDIKSRNYKMMWTGIGVGIGGVVLLGTGLGLWSKYYNNPLDKNHKHVEMSYKLSIGLMGVGSVLTLSGVILAAVFGNYYKKDQAYSFDVSPTGAAFRMVF